MLSGPSLLRFVCDHAGAHPFMGQRHGTFEVVYDVRKSSNDGNHFKIMPPRLFQPPSHINLRFKSAPEFRVGRESPF
jgi:hypothetical protein